jgi:hypothetical protein
MKTKAHSFFRSLFPLVLFLAMLSSAAGKPFRESMYLIMIGPEPGKSGPMSWMLVAKPEMHEAPPNMMKKQVGGPFASQEEVLANKDKLQIISLGPVVVQAYDSLGKQLSGFETIIPPSNSGAGFSGSGPSDAPLTGSVGFGTASAPQTQQERDAASPNDSPFRIAAFTGEVTIFRGSDETITIRAEHVGKLRLRWDDRILTGTNASLRLTGPAETIEIPGDTDYKLGQSGQGDSERIRIILKAGEVNPQIDSKSQTGSGLEVETGTAVAGARGTKFRSHYDRQKQANRIEVQEGEVLVTPKNRSLAPRILSAGQWCIVYSDRIEPADAGRPADANKLRGLSMEKRVGRPGVQLTLPVLLNNVTTDAASGLGNVNFEVSYDPAVVQIAGKVSRGNIYGSGFLFEANAKDADRIRIGFAGARGVTQSGTVAQIPFKIVGRPGQQTELALKLIQSQTPGGQSASLPTTNGRITIPAPVASSGTTAGGPAGAQPVASGVSGAVGPGGACGIAGDWEYKVGNTVSRWTFTANDKGGYDAQQTGYGQVVGPARVQGTRLIIDWRGYTNSGTNEYEIDAACSSGTGKSIVRGGDSAGEYATTIRRLTVGREAAPTLAASKTETRPPAGASSQPGSAPPPPGQPAAPAGAGASSRTAAPQTARSALQNPDGTIKGDCDGDNRWTSSDAECALQMSVGSRPVDMNLDIDQDGNVMSADSRRILQAAVQ